jgi:hypothetical protein
VDLAKSEVVSWGLPHVVSKGGEKNFSHFMLEVENIYTEINEKIFKEMFFHTPHPPLSLNQVWL